MLIIFPYLKNGPIANQYDLQFHLSRIQESYINIKHGNLLGIIPDTNSKTFGSFLYPQNLFYPIYMLLPELIFHLIFKPWIAYCFYLFLVMFFILFSMYKVTFKITNSRFSGLISSILYGFSQFILTYLFYKCDIGQIIPMIFLPICFYGIYKILLKDYKKWLILSIGMTLSVYTHVLSSMIIFVFLFSLLGLLLFSKKRKVRFKYLLLSSFISLLLSSSFLFPILYNYKKIGGITVDIWVLYDNSISLLNLIFNYIPTNDTFAAGIGIAGIISIFIIIFSFKFYNNIYKYLSTVLIIFLLMSTNLFPRQFFQDKLEMIQSPGRFLIIVSFLSAFLAGYGINLIVYEWNTKFIVSLIMSFTLLSMFTSANMFLIKNAGNLVNHDSKIVTENEFEKYESESVVLDYLPKKSKGLNNAIIDHSIPNVNEYKDIKQLRYTTSYNRIRYDINSNKNYNSIKIPNVYYPGFHVYGKLQY